MTNAPTDTSADQSAATDPEQYLIGDVHLDVNAQTAQRNGEELQLPRLSFAVLVSLARRAPNVVSNDELLAECWGEVVVNDETVTQRIKLIRNALGEYQGDEYITTVRGRGYRIALPVTRPDPNDGSGGPGVRRYAIAVAATVVVAIAAVSIWTIGTSPPPARSVAVLPFTNVDADPATEYFTDGLTDAVLNRLARVQGLRVPSRTSSFFYKGKDAGLAEIASQLDVSSVLEGSVQRSATNVRINVQLVDARSDSLIWSRVFEHDIADVFLVQDQVASAVAAVLELPAPSVLQASIDEERFDRYLRAVELVRSRTPRGLKTATELLTDIDYAPAQALLANAYLEQTRRANMPREEALTLAKQVLQRAIAADDQSPEVHTAIGMLRAETGELDGARESFIRAIELNPNYSEAHLLLGFNSMARGRTEEAMQHYQAALALDPLNESTLDAVAINNLVGGRYEVGISQFQRRLLIDPEQSDPYRQLALWARTYGRFDDALIWARKAVELDPEAPLNINELIMANSAIGELATAGEWLDRAYATAPNNHWVIVLKAYTLYNQSDWTGLQAFTTDQLSMVPPRGPEPLNQLARIRLSLAGLAANQAGDYASAATHYERAIGAPFMRVLEPQFHINSLAQLSWAYHNLGDERAQATLDECVSIIEAQTGLLARQLIYPDVLAAAYVTNKDPEAAFAVLETAVDAGWAGLRALRAPQFDPIRGTAEFQAIVTKLTARIGDMRARVGLPRDSA